MASRILGEGGRRNKESHIDSIVTAINLSLPARDWEIGHRPPTQLQGCLVPRTLETEALVFDIHLPVSPEKSLLRSSTSILLPFPTSPVHFGILSLIVLRLCP